MKVGDRVRVVGLPEDLPLDGDPAGLNTTSLLRSCLGHVFPVASFSAEGRVELEVGEVVGKPPYMSSVWIEPRFLELVGSGQ